MMGCKEDVSESKSIESASDTVKKQHIEIEALLYNQAVLPVEKMI